MMNRLIFILFISNIVIASDLKIEPIYGVETTQRQYPKPAKTVTNTYLGMRALYGPPLLAAEFEIAQAVRTENFSEENKKIDFTTQRAMLGIRTYPFTSKYVGFYFRTGARARKEIREITQNGETSRNESDIQLDPYGGTGLTIAFGQTFALNAGATLVYNNRASSAQQYDALYTFSFTIRTGNAPQARSF